MKLHHDLKIRYSCIWHLSYRIPKAWDQYYTKKFDSEHEVDESFFGGKEGNAP